MTDLLMNSKKIYYKLSEVCSIIDVKPYVLRFWIGEFEELYTIKNEEGETLFTIDSIERIQFVKQLLFEKKYTIEKAKLELTKKIEKEDPTIQIEIDQFEEEENDDLPPKTELVLAKEKLHQIIGQVEKVLSSI